jgi:Guanine nucleotide exchange factor synembryn
MDPRAGYLSKVRIAYSFSVQALTHLSPDAAQGLLAVKTLGKNLSSSEYLSSSTNLSTLLALFTLFKDDSDASSEALRCIANALLLVENARSTFVQREVDGGAICISLLEVSRPSLFPPLVPLRNISLMRRARNQQPLIRHLFSLVSCSFAPPRVHHLSNRWSNRDTMDALLWRLSVESWTR